MKRLVMLVVVLAAAVTAASAMAAPAPKTTGGIGYTAYSDVQRHLSFNAIQSKTDTCGTFWNVKSVSQFTFRLTGDTTDYTHHVTLTQNGQTVGGSGGYPLTGGDQYHWNVTDGSIVGNALSLTAEYDLGATGTVMHITGTVASDGSISGTWDDNFGGARTGTFTAPAGSATAYATYCGKGNAYYSDAGGNWYFVNVKAVNGRRRRCMVRWPGCRRQRRRRPVAVREGARRWRARQARRSGVGFVHRRDHGHQRRDRQARSRGRPVHDHEREPPGSLDQPVTEQIRLVGGPGNRPSFFRQAARH